MALTFSLWAAVARADDPAVAEPVAAQPVAAQPVAAQPAVAEDLQSPAQRNTLYSAYSLPAGMWSFEVTALGSSVNDLYGLLGVGYGFKRGFQLDVNLVHWIAAVFDLELRWNFFESKHLALGAGVGFLYAHGAWIWVLGDATRSIIGDMDLYSLPVSLTASAPVNRWLQFDLMVAYRHTLTQGRLEAGRSVYAESEIGARQLVIRPTGRLYLSESTALELSAKLPVYNRVPYEVDPTLMVRDKAYGKPRNGYASADFSESWNVELGLRSALRRWLFVTVSVQFGQIPRNIYGTWVSPWFGLVFRL
jgi:hypothetical protein